MAKNRTKDGAIALTRCPDCGHSGQGALVRRSVNHEWLEGVEEKRRYCATIDVVACTRCGAEVIDEHARLQQHEVWCRENGLLGPREIRKLRKSLRLTLPGFARLLGLGSASVGRWERGITVQNRANDRFMRLLAIPGSVDELSRLSGVSVGGASQGRALRVVSEDGARGEWRILHSKHYRETEDARERERRFPLSVRTA